MQVRKPQQRAVDGQQMIVQTDLARLALHDILQPRQSDDRKLAGSGNDRRCSG